VLRYQVRLQKTSIGSGVYNYAFAYQIDTSPNLVQAAPLGNINVFDSPIEPGSYRVDQTLATCNASEDLFMTGINRDTGEAFCAAKPLMNRCPDGHIPKALNFVKFEGQKKSGTVQLECTSQPMRTIRCPANYALQSFSPPYADPENTSFGGSVPGDCVFLTAQSATLPGVYPSSPTAPYVSRVSGNFCPPYYNAGNAGCNLVPDETRNANYDFRSTNDNRGGKGICPTKLGIRNCSRSAYEQEWIPNPNYDSELVAWNNYISAIGSFFSYPSGPYYSGLCYLYENWYSPTCAYPSAAPYPQQQFLIYTCGPYTEYTAECGEGYEGAGPSNPSPCGDHSGWSGTHYAADWQEVSPSARAVGSGSGRGFSCSFTDTSTACRSDIPTVDRTGRSIARAWKSPRWYGGVQVQGVMCSLESGKERATAY